ncbi:MAG: hypothetical protein IPK19_39755 [Chloroflexi bacterium]|nr:hypothetical protein [Chloroflexota bacterium]
MVSLNADQYWFLCVDDLHSGWVELTIQVQWSVGGSNYERQIVLPVIVTPRTEFLIPTLDDNIYTPGELVIITVPWEPYDSVAPGFAALLLEPNGDRTDIAFGTIVGNSAQVGFVLPNGPFGGYGLELVLSDEPVGGGVRYLVAPTSYVRWLLDLAPAMPADLGQLDSADSIIICSQTDASIAEDPADGMNIPIDPGTVYYYEYHLLGDLLTLASQHDTILIDTGNTNPLVSVLGGGGDCRSDYGRCQHPYRPDPECLWQSRRTDPGWIHGR